jgi:hypothetical protein
LKQLVKTNKPVFSDTSWLFATIFSTYSFFMLCFWAFYMKQHPSENADKLLFIGSAFFSVSSSYLVFRLNNLKQAITIPLFAIISLSIGIIVKENQAMSREHVMGFGLSVYVIAVFLVFLFMYFMKIIETKIFYFSSLIFAIFCSVLAILSFYQTRNSLIESQHSEYVVNELLAPRTGYTQYRSFIPQYTFVLGYVFTLIPQSVSVFNAIQIIVITLTITAFISLLVAIYISASFLKGIKNRWLIAAAIIIPLTSVTAGWSRTSFVGPPTTLLSGPAIRVFCGMVLAICLLIFINLKNSENIKKSNLKIAALGIIAGIESLINFDFGLAAALALYLTIILLSSNKIEFIKSSLVYGIAFISTWILVIGILIATGNSPKSDLFAWFIRQFGGGFGSVTISYPGPVMFALPTIFTIMIYSLVVTWKYLRSERTETENFNLKISIFTFYFSAWCFFSTPYYLNRSYHSGQMSTLYLPLSVAIAGVFALYIRNKGFIFKNFHSFVPALVIAVSIGSIWISPNPSIEIKRIQGNNPDGNLPRPEISQIIKNQENIKSEMKNFGEFAYFGEEGNIIESATKIKSANIFNNPLDMFQSNNSIKLQCDFLNQLNYNYLLLSSTATGAFAWDDGSLCDGMYKIDFELESNSLKIATKILK